MGQPINQNNIIDVINSNIEFIDNICDSIVKSNATQIAKRSLKSFKESAVGVLSVIRSISKYMDDIDVEKFMKLNDLITTFIDVLQSINKNISGNPLRLALKINSLNSILLQLKPVFKNLKKLSKYAKKIDSEKVTKAALCTNDLSKSINDMPMISPILVVKLIMLSSAVSLMSVIAIQLTILIPTMIIGNIGATLIRNFAVKLSVGMSALRDALKDFIKVYLLMDFIRIFMSGAKKVAKRFKETIAPAMKTLFTALFDIYPKISMRKYIKLRKRISRFNNLMDMMKKFLIPLVISFILMVYVISDRMIETARNRINGIKDFMNDHLAFINDMNIGMKTLYKVWLIKNMINTLKGVYTDVIILFGVLWLFNRFVANKFFKQLNKFQEVILKIADFFKTTNEKMGSPKIMLIAFAKVTSMLLAIGALILGISALERKIGKLRINSLQVFITFIASISKLADAVMRVEKVGYKSIFKGILKVTMIATAMLPLAVAVAGIVYVLDELTSDKLQTEKINSLSNVLYMVIQLNDMIIRTAEQSKSKTNPVELMSMYKAIGITLLALIPVALFITALAAPATLAAFATLPVTLFVLGLVPVVWGISMLMRTMKHMKNLGIRDAARFRALRVVILELAAVSVCLSIMNLVRPSVFDMIALDIFVVLLGIFILEVMGLVWILNNPMLKINLSKSGQKNFFELGKIILEITVIAVLLAAMRNIAEEATWGTLYATGFLIVLVIFVGLIKIAFKIIDLIIGKDTFKSLTELLVIIGIITSVAILLIGLGFIGIMVSAMILPILGVIGCIVGFVLVVVGLGYLMAAAVEFLAPAMIGLLIMLAIIGIVFLMVGMLWLLGKMELDTKQIMKNVRTVFDVIKEIVQLVMFSEVSDDPTKNTGGGNEGFGDFIVKTCKGLLQGAGTIISLILSIPMLLLAFLSISLIFLIVTMLWGIGAMELNPDQILKNVQTVFDVIESITAAVFNKDKEDPSNNTGGNESFGDFIITCIKKFASGLEFIGNIISLIIAVPMLLLTYLSVTIIFAISGMLRVLQELELNPDQILINVDTVIKTANAISGAIFGDGKDQPEKKDKPWYESLWDFATGPIKSMFKLGKNIAGAITAIPYLLLILISTGLVLAIVNVLNKIAEFNLKTEDITGKVKQIFDVANAVIDAIFNEDRKTISIRDQLQMSTMINCLKQFAGMVNSLKLPDANSLVNTIASLEKLPDIAKNSLALLDHIQNHKNFDQKTKNNLDILERFNNIYKQFSNITDDDVRRSKEYSDNYIRFIDKVDGANLENLKTTERLFKNMAQFSESINGNFNELAEALNEKIAPLLEELKELVGKVPEHMDKNSANQIRSQVETVAGKVSQTTMENSGMSNLEQTIMKSSESDRKKAAYKKATELQKIIKLLEGNDGEGGVKVRM